MENSILIFVLVGFIAQMIDGALGMAYGLSSTTFLISCGIPPAIASASVHTAEVFTSGISGLSHWKLGNVDRRLFRGLLIPGVAGGILGAYILSSLPGERIKPFVSLYLIVMGLVIILKIFRSTSKTELQRGIIPLGLVGGILDGIGGGGWGPI